MIKNIRDKSTSLVISWEWVAFLFLVFAFIFPSTSFAQYVPVRDDQLITDFGTFSTNFSDFASNFTRSINTDPDSLRNIIAGGNPQGRAIEECRTILVSDPTQANEVAEAYTQGAWASSSEATASLSNPIPTTIDPLVNSSASLRCLLQEIVEWQKLGLSIQIHAMLKTYIADAQTKQLNNQLMNRISAAALNHAKAGNSVTNNGVVTSEAIYVTNLNQSIYNINARQLDHFTAQAAADPSAPGPVGSLGVCDPWRLDVAANTALNNQAITQDRFSIDDANSTCNLPGGGANYSTFSESFNDPAGVGGGGMPMWLTTLNCPGCSPLGTLTAADSQAQGRILRQEQVTRDKLANSGSRPITECSGLPEDPYCLDQQFATDVTPAYQTSAKTTFAAATGDNQVAGGNSLDGTAASSSEVQSTALNQSPGGMFGFDETSLALSQTAVTRLVAEFYDTIEWGYYATRERTQDWAQATMLMIYDEMKFDPVTPQVVVTDGEAAVDTNY